MTDPGPLDLGQLTLSACRALVGEEFRRPNDSGPDVVLRLESAEPGRLDPSVKETPDRPFSILFKGPLDPRLTQGMHDLEHPTRPLAGIFLVPVEKLEDGYIYEAVFN